MQGPESESGARPEDAEIVSRPGFWPGRVKINLISLPEHEEEREALRDVLNAYLRYSVGMRTYPTVASSSDPAGVAPKPVRNVTEGLHKLQASRDLSVVFDSSNVFMGTGMSGPPEFQDGPEDSE